MTVKIPTDLQILDAICEEYYSEYVKYNKESPSRAAKIYVPIDIPKIAKKLKTEDDIVFGRLYYHLDHKFGYQNGEHSVHFFSPAIGQEPHRDIHCINFPYMASVLADLRDEHSIKTWSLRLSWLSLGVAILSVCFTAATYSSGHARVKGEVQKAVRAR